MFSILGGFASSLTFTPSVAVIGHWFNKKRGNATGIAATGGAVGGIVFPLLLENLIPKIGVSIISPNFPTLQSTSLSNFNVVLMDNACNGFHLRFHHHSGQSPH